MSRVFADITYNNHGETAEAESKPSTPKLRRLNIASRKISREIRLAVLAHDAVALRAALKSAEELDMDTHLIKAARSSLVDMENSNDENIAPGCEKSNVSKEEIKVSTSADKITKTRPGENSVESILKTFPESISKTSFDSNSDSDHFIRTDDFEKLTVSEGEKDPSHPDVVSNQERLAYSLNFPQHPLFDHKKDVVQSSSDVEGKSINEGLSGEIDHYKNSLQPVLSERIARIKLESAKIDVCCRDFCLFFKFQHSAQEKSAEALAECSNELSNMGSMKSDMTIDGPRMLIQNQMLGRSNKHREMLISIRKEFIIPVATSIPAMEIEIRSLFEEIAFLEMECSKAMMDLERANKQGSKVAGCSKDDADCIETVTGREARRLSGLGITVREPRRLSGIGVNILRRPSTVCRFEGEYSSQYDNICAKIEAAVTLKRLLSEYTRRIPEIIEIVAAINSQRLQLIKNALSNIAIANQRQLEEELSEQKGLLNEVELIDSEKDLSHLRSLSELKGILPENRLVSAEPSNSKEYLGEHFADPNRLRSFAIDFWAGQGIDIVLEHALSSKQTLCNLNHLITSLAQVLQQRSELLSKSVKLVQSQVNTEQARIGDLQLHAFQTLIDATRIQAASYDACSVSLKQASSELRVQKQLLKSIHRSICEGRSRSVKELNVSIAHEAKCKDLRDKLELELSHSQKQIQECASSYKICPNQGQLEALLGKQERDERAFRQADLAYRNVQHSIKAMRETQAIMQCQFLSKLQSAEESRLQTCVKVFRTLGYGVRDLVNAIEQADLDVMSSFAAVDINKDLKQFIRSTYSTATEGCESAVDYVADLSSDGFGPAYDYALSGLTQMKHMLTLLEQWADSSEYIKSLSKVRTLSPNTELASIQSAMMQCQHLVFEFCQSVDDHAASHREIISSVDKQRHMLKAEARKIRKKFATVHRRVTLATQNHSQAAETQRRLTEKLEVVRQQNANASQNNTYSGKFNLSKLFSRDLSKTLHKTEEGVTSSKTALDKLLQELTAAIREREAVVQSSLHSLQELENNRMAALNWCIPTLINHRQEISSQIADLAQTLILSCDEIDIKSDLQVFIRSNSLGIPPPAFLFDRASESGLVTGEKSNSRTKSRGNTHSYNSDDEEGISRSTFSIGEETPSSDEELFGGNLSNAPVQNGVAKVVASCIAFLSSRPSQITVNTFRDSAPAEDVSALINEFRRDPNLVLVTQTTACVATVLKIYISQLQPALIPSTMVSELLSIYKNACTSQRCLKVAAWLSRLPTVHRNTFKLVLLFLSEISLCPTTQATNMAVTNLAISWSPVLLRSAVGTTIQTLSRLLHDTPTIFKSSGESN